LLLFGLLFGLLISLDGLDVLHDVDAVDGTCVVVVVVDVECALSSPSRATRDIRVMPVVAHVVAAQ
jgi:hypothetical protein